MNRYLALLLLPLLLLASCQSTSTSLRKMYADSVDDRSDGGALTALDPDYQEDQADRREKVWRYIIEEKLTTAEDFLYAGSLLVSSSNPDDLVAAKLSGLKAAELGDDRGWRLTAEAIDRHLMIAGKPQHYGTQVEYIEVLQKCRLYQVDPRTTDEEGASMGVEPIAELRARAETASERLQ